MSSAIRIEQLVKTFGSTRALDGLDLEVRPGEVHGFLGPNGSGKTVTIRILLGLLRADSGTVSMLGGDPWRDAVELHRHIAYVPGDVNLWPNLSGGFGAPFRIGTLDDVKTANSNLPIDEGFPAYVAIALAGTIGYTIGSIIGWAIGLYGGRPYLERHGRWLHLDKERLDRAERWFERWEDWAVFLGRLTPVVRSFVSVPAGVMEVPFVRYALLTLLGSAIWCFAFAGAGYVAGESWEDFHHAFRYFDYLVAAAVVGAVGWLTLRYVRRRRARAQESSAS